ncbi:MAG: ABC transporter ATP-binding protein, partial [Actinomycetota bacterium]|nr:ABC transporter ATP-binding protein [Actinomycetota bacterium]
MTPGEDRRPATDGARQALDRAQEEPSAVHDRRERARLAKEDLRRRLRATSGRGRKLRGLMALLRPYRGRLILALLALIAATAAALAPAPLAALAIDEGLVPGDIATLDLVVLGFLAAALVYWGASCAQTYLVGWVGQRALADLRLRVFRHLQELSIGFYERNRSGVLISRLTNDVQALDRLVTDSVVTLFQASLTLVGTIVILLFLDVELALLTFLVLPLMALASLIFRLAAADAYRHTRETIGGITASLQETLSGIRVVRTFGRERDHRERFAGLNDANRAANMKTVRRNAA